MSERRLAAIVFVAAMSLASVAAAQRIPKRFGIGHAPTRAQIRAWDIDVAPDGTGLPPGAGTARKGAGIYLERCAACHGETGKEGPQDVLVGGRGSLASGRPVRTIGSYWPYATTIYDYVNRAMPIGEPGSLKPDEVYSVTAYLLYLNGIVGIDKVIDARSLPRVKMPNRDGFRPDPRPDTRGGQVRRRPEA